MSGCEEKKRSGDRTKDTDELRDAELELRDEELDGVSGGVLVEPTMTPRKSPDEGGGPRISKLGDPRDPLERRRTRRGTRPRR